MNYGDARCMQFQGTEAGGQLADWVTIGRSIAVPRPWPPVSAVNDFGCHDQRQPCDCV